MERRIERFLEQREKEGLLRRLTEIVPKKGGFLLVDGRKYVNFSSNDYLGLSSHPGLARAAGEALSPVVGASASRLMTGSTSLHHLLEGLTAGFKGKPASLVFNSGYQANVGIISALCGKDDCVFSDRLNHASIIDGIRLSGAKLFRFRHNDTHHLEELLRKERNRCKGALIVTETVFSMDGDIAPLKRITELKKEHDCMLMVDEAHATGIFGKKGSGIVEEEGAAEEVDIIMGTFSKALGGFGSYAAVSEMLKGYLVNTCRSFIYSTALPPSVISADIASLDLVEKEPYRRETLLSNSGYFRDKLMEKGFHVTGTSQILPIITGDNRETLDMSDFLKAKGYWVTPVRPPTVPNGQARLRISLTYDHTREMLDEFIEDICKF
ncbi:MAG: 8-amino-7-oxononanoate synthase [Candidatus Omnitrophota bacterium]|nr:8-amino-7-oxononanoate synthase [Candidatus Omnitrophota bacterium]